MTAISVTDLHKSYDGTEAVRGVSFDVAAGEVFCLLGPNGAGKTTTVEILEGYRLADSGTVRVLGADPARGERPLRDRLGIVLQSGGLQPELTVAEVLEMYGRWYERTRPVDELLELVELADERDARVCTLSGGQQRRLDLALGLVGDPEVLFLDEPTTGFDPGARRRAWSTIRSLCSLGKTVVLTTHVEVVGQVGRGDEVLDAARAARPDVALLDIEMPGVSGLDAAAALHAELPETRVLILTTFGRPGYLRRAMESGAAGFLLKDAPGAELARAIRRAMAGDKVVDPGLAAEALSEGESPLTPREREVLDRARRDGTIAEIAASLHLSPGTTRNHLSSIMGKLGAQSRIEAIRIAEEKGWL